MALRRYAFFFSSCLLYNLMHYRALCARRRISLNGHCRRNGLRTENETGREQKGRIPGCRDARKNMALRKCLYGNVRTHLSHDRVVGSVPMSVESVPQRHVEAKQHSCDRERNTKQSPIVVLQFIWSSCSSSSTVETSTITTHHFAVICAIAFQKNEICFCFDRLSGIHS
jgi:hypothetical protein